LLTILTDNTEKLTKIIIYIIICITNIIITIMTITIIIIERGSIKDEAIILLFLGSTGILLTYAIMKKYFANNYEDAMKYNYTTLNNNSN